jgi:hypothetical protein
MPFGEVGQGFGGGLPLAQRTQDAGLGQGGSAARGIRLRGDTPRLGGAPALAAQLQKLRSQASQARANVACAGVFEAGRAELQGLFVPAALGHPRGQQQVGVGAGRVSLERAAHVGLRILVAATAGQLQLGHAHQLSRADGRCGVLGPGESRLQCIVEAPGPLVHADHTRTGVVALDVELQRFAVAGQGRVQLAGRFQRRAQQRQVLGALVVGSVAGRFQAPLQGPPGTMDLAHGEEHTRLDGQCFQRVRIDGSRGGGETGRRLEIAAGLRRSRSNQGRRQLGFRSEVRSGSRQIEAASGRGLRFVRLSAALGQTGARGVDLRSAGVPLAAATQPVQGTLGLRGLHQLRSP